MVFYVCVCDVMYVCVVFLFKISIYCVSSSSYCDNNNLSVIKNELCCRKKETVVYDHHCLVSRKHILFPIRKTRKKGSLFLRRTKRRKENKK